MEIELPRPVQKHLRKLLRSNAEDAKNIRRRLLELMENPLPPDARRMRSEQGAEHYRIRAGDYRIIYAIAENTLQIIAIGRRNDAEVYKKYARRKK